MHKHTRAGLLTTAGLGALALTVTTMALPAAADDSTWSSDETVTSVSAADSLDAFQTWVDGVMAAYGNDTSTGDVGIDGGVVNGPVVDGPLVSDVGNGAVLSGNDTPVLSGNDVQAPVGSGNDVSTGDIGSGNVVGSGNDTGASVGDIGTGDVTSDVGDITSDIGADVDGLVDDISGDVDSLVSGLLD